MIKITDRIIINENEIKLDFIHSSGPGGQNVNKVATAVQLRFDVDKSSLTNDIKKRLINISGKRITKDGILIIFARKFSKQELNRKDAVDRLIKLILKATEKPKLRTKTKTPFYRRYKDLKQKVIELKSNKCEILMIHLMLRPII